MQRLVFSDSTVVSVVGNPIFKVKSPASPSWIFAKQRVASLPQDIHTLLPAISFSRDILHRIANRLAMVIPSYVSMVTIFIWAFGGDNFVFWFHNGPAKTLLDGPII